MKYYSVQPGVSLSFYYFSVQPPVCRLLVLLFVIFFQERTGKTEGIKIPEWAQIGFF